mmetsp:Transcript_23601/g.93261  ORF Transcript_23601/g.93261 Transcript_23601/m.93261 type:complete len:213 (+) Transcript_23601:124-762(+)
MAGVGFVGGGVFPCQQSRPGQHRGGSLVWNRGVRFRLVTRGRAGGAGAGAGVVMSSWYDFHASQKIEAPADYVFQEYTRLEDMPNWAPWLQSVELEGGPDLISKWSIASSGLKFSWRAKITQLITGKLISWESIEGLKNRGSVSFRTLSNEECEVSIRLGFELPQWLRTVFHNQFVKNFVSDKLQSELRIFRSLLLRKKRRLKSTERNASSI